AKPANDSKVIVWEVETSKPLRTVVRFKDGYASLVFSPDGRRLILSTTSGIVLHGAWEDKTDQLKRPFTSGNSKGSPLVVSRQGKLLATAGFDKAVRVWDLKTGAEAATLPGARTPMAFNAEGTRLATDSEDQKVKL